MNQYATTYADACKIRDELAGKLRPSSVKLAKEMFDDAQARLEPKQGYQCLLFCVSSSPDADFRTSVGIICSVRF